MNDIGAIILAAGMSTRMGKPKQFLLINGKPLFRYAVERALQAKQRPIVVVGGEHVDQLHFLCRDLPQVEIIYNPNYKTGIASSLKLGIEAVRHKTKAAMIYLADQPLVPHVLVESLQKIYWSHKSNEVLIVRPQYNGIAGHPVLIDASLYPEFEHLQGDEGGKSILKRYHHCLKHFPCTEPIWGADVDTEEDLNRIQSLLK